ncbi:Uracil phosphoribosyltransferase, synthesizes UMP from uracil [Borealophlyctis nickersoniae]|nr:Uracil phosphoribosyltransferase, synthesizes UMP from uracil [Borealophlyctis nickersoniae]
MVAFTVPPQVVLLEQTPEIKSLLSIIRNRDTKRGDFIFYRAEYQGLAFKGKICGVSIMRAGEAMEQGLRDCCRFGDLPSGIDIASGSFDESHLATRSIRIGKILIQRDEETAMPQLYYAKLPPDIMSRFCLLLDPMLATGGSANKAIEGIQKVLGVYPKIKIITAEIDEGLDANKYIVPGLGDFGCRYFGTLDDS